MFKFLRKYNKYILAVGGTLLMITFLIPFAFDRLLQDIGQGRATWATVGGENPRKINVGELDLVQREMRLMAVAGTQLQMSVAIERAEYWFLLALEAQQAGLVRAPATILPTEQGQLQLAALAAVSGESVPFVRQTLAKVQGVQELLLLYLDGDKYSDRRLKQLARRLYHRVTVQPLVIAASPDGPGGYSERQLADQLEKYAIDPPGEGEMGFGYRLPDRARIERLVVTADSVREMVSTSDKLDPVALRKDWALEARKGRFGTPDDSPVPDEVRDDLLVRLTTRTLDTIARDANDRLRFARRGLGSSGGYVIIPDGWQGLSLQQLGLDFQAEYNLALPEYHAIGDRWLTAGGLAELDGIGDATSDKFGTTPIGLAALVMADRTLEGSSMIQSQTGIAGPALRGADGSIFVYRITATDPARAPDSVDEVRQELIADLNRLGDYRTLTENAQAIRQIAITDGLLALAMQYDTAVDATTSVTLGFPTITLDILQDQQVVESIIDHAMALPGDTPFLDLPDRDRVLLLPVEDRLSLLVVRLTDQSPLTRENFQTYMQYGIIQSKLLSEEAVEQDPGGGPFGYKALAARHDFTLTRVDDVAAAAETTPDDTPADAGF